MTHGCEPQHGVSRVLPAAALIAAVGCGGGTAGAAELQLSVAQTPHAASIALPGHGEVGYAVDVIGGDSTERFLLTIGSPTTSDGGAWMDVRADPRPHGDVRFRGVRAAQALPGCSTTRPRTGHGFHPTTTTIEVEVPAGGRGRITFTATLGAYVPPKPTPFRPTVSVENGSLQRGPWGTLAEEPGRIEAPAAPVDLNRTGVAIGLRTTPTSSATGGARTTRKIRRGRTISISGTTTPRLSRRRLVLSYVGPGSPRIQRLATVRTDRQGRFRLTGWRPRRTGYYELFARAPATPTTIADERCPRAFRLVR